MMERARAVLEQLGVAGPARIDVPAKGTGSAELAEGMLRSQIQEIVPALQSGSLFGGADGVLVVNAHNLLKAEAEVVGELVELAAAGGNAIAVFVAAGAVPAPLGKVLRKVGETLKVDRITERSAAEWLGKAARQRGMRLEREVATVLLQRFGSNVAALGQALDQMSGEGSVITADMVRSRFRNRPDEPMWHYADAIVDGSQGEALRRLADFLQHDHPLVLLAFMQNDVRRRALAAAAPDYETFVDQDGGRKGYGMEKVWKQRSRIKGSDLRNAVRALAKADLQLKTAPEVTHRVTLERLTVALCRWYGGSRH